MIHVKITESSSFALVPNFMKRSKPIKLVIGMFWCVYWFTPCLGRQIPLKLNFIFLKNSLILSNFFFHTSYAEMENCKGFRIINIWIRINIKILNHKHESLYFIKSSLKFVYSRKQLQGLYSIPQVLDSLSSWPCLHLVLWISEGLLKRFDNGLAINLVLSINCSMKDFFFFCNFFSNFCQFM